MEKLNDVYNNIKERFTNPLIFSFICSWLVINWEITVGLIWYDSAQIKNSGAVSIFSFIDEKISCTDSFWSPLGCAIIYTFLIPVLKNFVRAFHSWTSKWGDKWNLKILAGGQISINKYLKLKEDLDKRTKKLESVISDESAYLVELDKSRTELLDLKAESNQAKIDLLNYKNFRNQLYDVSILNGAWKNTYKINQNETGTESIIIENGSYYVISTMGEKNHVFDIRYFNHNSENRTIFFVKVLARSHWGNRHVNERISVNNLEIVNDDILKGVENETTLIEYRRNSSI